MYEISLKRNPNRFNSIYGIATAYKKLGDKENTKLYFEKLHDLTKNSNSDRPELKKIQDYTEQKTI